MRISMAALINRQRYRSSLAEIVAFIAFVVKHIIRRTSARTTQAFAARSEEDLHKLLDGSVTHIVRSRRRTLPASDAAPPVAKLITEITLCGVETESHAESEHHLGDRNASVLPRVAIHRDHLRPVEPAQGMADIWNHVRGHRSLLHAGGHCGRVGADVTCGVPRVVKPRTVHQEDLVQPHVRRSHAPRCFPDRFLRQVRRECAVPLPFSEPLERRPARISQATCGPNLRLTLPQRARAK